MWLSSCTGYPRNSTGVRRMVMAIIWSSHLGTLLAVLTSSVPQHCLLEILNYLSMEMVVEAGVHTLYL